VADGGAKNLYVARHLCLSRWIADATVDVAEPDAVEIWNHGYFQEKNRAVTFHGKVVQPDP